MSETIVIPASGTVDLFAWSEFDGEQVFDFTGQLHWRRPVVALVFNRYKNPRGPVGSDKDGDSLMAEPLVVSEYGSVFTVYDYLHSLMGGDHWEHAHSIYEPHVSGPVGCAPRFRRLSRAGGKQQPPVDFCTCDDREADSPPCGLHSPQRYPR